MESFEYSTKWKKLLEKERIADESITKNEILNLSCEKREKKGRALDLMVCQNNPKLEKENIYRFVKSNSDKFSHTEISIGDCVLVAISKSVNPIDSGIIGEVISKSEYHLDILFTKVSNFLKESQIVVHKYVNEITYKIQTDILANFKDFKNEILKEIILENRVSRRIKINDLIFFDNLLNSTQKKAVKQSLEEMDFFLIVGPPGTGKTKTATEIIKQHLKLGKKILVSADSNIAVDNIMELCVGYCDVLRIGNSPKLLDSIQNFTLDKKMKNSKEYYEYERYSENIKHYRLEQSKFIFPSKELRQNMGDLQILKSAQRDQSIFGVSSTDLKSMAEWIKLQYKIKESVSKMSKLKKVMEEKIISSAKIIFATNTSAHILKEDFDVLIIDEAAQSTEPSCLVPISKAKKVILIGDHNQLPPTVISKDANELSISLFERLIKKMSNVLLDVSYRMIPVINDFSSKTFYNGQLISGLVEDKNYYNGFPYESAFVFIDVDSKEQKYKDTSSYYNEKEIEVIFDIVTKYPKDRINANDLGIISPYLEQVKLLHHNFIGFEIKTVDGFQGREKNIIILSLVRSNNNHELGFLKDYRRLNVAVTRAKKQLIIVGNSKTLKNDAIYNKLIEYIKENGQYVKYD